MSAASDAWEDVKRDHPMSPQTRQAGDALAAILDRLEQEAEEVLPHASPDQRSVLAEVLRIIREAERQDLREHSALAAALEARDRRIAALEAGLRRLDEEWSEFLPPWARDLLAGRGGGAG